MQLNVRGGGISVCEICVRIFTGLVIIGQTCLLDYFLVKNLGFGALGWIIADVLVLSVFAACNILAFRYFIRMQRKQISPSQEMGLLPYAFIIWIVYSGVLVAKIAVMFKGFARSIPAEGLWGTNMMKIAIGASAGVFALLVAGHHRSRASHRHTFCLKWMQSHVVFEILDTVEFLSILFINEDQLLLPFAIEDAIIAYSCINLIVPFVALYQLSSVNFARSNPKENFTLIQTFLATVLVNFPYMVIRLYLWHTLEYTTALFIVKNFIAVVSSFWELRTFVPCCARAELAEHEDHNSEEDPNTANVTQMELLRKAEKNYDPTLQLQIPTSDS